MVQITVKGQDAQYAKCRHISTYFVFRNDFETSFRLEQSTNQRLAPVAEEISRHKKHRQNLNGNFHCRQHSSNKWTKTHF